MHRKNLLLILLASLLFAACSAPATQATEPAAAPTVMVDSSIITEGRLEPVRSAKMAFTASGTISEVLVEAGQAVKEGDTLIRLGDETDINYASAQLELVRAQQALNELNNTAGTQLAQAVIDLKEAQEAYDDAFEELEKLKNNKEILQTQSYRVPVKTAKGTTYEVRTRTVKAPAPQEWITNAENDLALKKSALDAARRAYDRQKGGVDVEQLAVLEARLTAAEAGLAAFSVTAPFDGVVADLPAKEGSSIQAGQPAITVADFSKWVIRTTDLTEIDVVNLSEGGAVTVTLDAIPGEELSGEILSIGQTYAENQGDVVYEVTVVLTDIHPAMRWGMTAAVMFEAAE